MMEDFNEDYELEGLLARDPAIVEQWFRCHADTVYTFVYNKVGRNSELAEDIVQDTFLDGIKRLHQFDAGRASMAGWLIMLSRNFIRKALRHKKNIMSNSDSSLPESKFMEYCEKLSSQPMPDEIVAGNETAELVEGTLANMPGVFAEILRVRYYQGKSIAQIAAVRNISESAAKVLLHRARKSFEKAFIKLDSGF